MPTSMQMNTQFPTTTEMETLTTMTDMINMIITTIMTIVLLKMMKLTSSKSFNMEMTENQELEMIWTILPFLILSFLILPSIKSLYMMESCSFCGMTIKVSGNQWYWSYSYQNENSLVSYMEMMKEGQIRMMEVDNNLVIPVETPVKLMISSTDVIHSWTVPSAGIKTDAIPGRINQICTMMKKVGTLHGQCSEICGTNHSFMPIVVESIQPKMFIKMMIKN